MSRWTEVAKGAAWAGLGVAVWMFPALWSTWSNDTKAWVLAVSASYAIALSVANLMGKP